MGVYNNLYVTYDLTGDKTMAEENKIKKNRNFINTSFFGYSIYCNMGDSCSNREDRQFYYKPTFKNS